MDVSRCSFGINSTPIILTGLVFYSVFLAFLWQPVSCIDDSRSCLWIGMREITHSIQISCIITGLIFFPYHILGNHPRHQTMRSRLFAPPPSNLARDSTPMRSPRPFDSGDERHHISTHLLWRHPILPSVPESVQLCQAQLIPSPIMATNGDAGRGKLAT